MNNIETINILIRMWLLGLYPKKDIDYILNNPQESLFWVRKLGMLPPDLNQNDPECSVIDNTYKLFYLSSPHFPGIITECQAQNCIDVSRATKQNQTIPVHSKFQYFTLMLFYTHRIEHVIRTYTKLWLEGQPPDADMNELTARFREQDVLFDKMFERFQQGHAHVKASLEAYMCQN